MAPLDSITAWADANGGTVTFNNGADPARRGRAAAAADVAIVFGYYREGEFADRPNIALDGNGDALIDAVAAANPQHRRRAADRRPGADAVADKVKGVLEVWYAGEQMGPAVADLLSGRRQPVAAS